METVTVAISPFLFNIRMLEIKRSPYIFKFSVCFIPVFFCIFPCTIIPDNFPLKASFPFPPQERCFSVTGLKMLDLPTYYPLSPLTSIPRTKLGLSGKVLIANPKMRMLMSKAKGLLAGRGRKGGERRGS